MAIIKIGKQFDDSSASIKVKTSSGSTLEVSADNQYDRSKRTVVVEDHGADYSIEATNERKSSQSQSNMGVKKLATTGRDLWIRGGFFLSTILTVMTVIALISIHVKWYAVPVSIVGGVLVAYLFALILLPKAKLTEKGFLQVLTQFSQIALTKRKR